MRKTEKNRHRRHRAEVQVQALFSDYDGTISPLGVPRSESRVSPESMAVLKKISRKIPVAVITTKDLSFVARRTPFARAWSVLGGSETKIDDVVIRKSCLIENAPYLVEALECAKRLSDDYLTIEEKRDSSGVTVAFSVDWRQTRDKRKAVARVTRILSQCRRQQLVTIKYKDQPFLDVLPCAVDKGEALSKLKKKLGLRRGVLYMGDSSVDNPAFEAADIAVGVIHRETPDDLVCDYYVRFEQVATFLQSLLENDLCFTPSLPTVLGRTEALRYIHGRRPS